MCAKRILVPVKGEPVDEAVLKLACDLAHPAQGKVFLLYVIEIPREFPVDADLSEETAKGEEVLRAAEERVKGLRCEVGAGLVQAREAGAAVVKEAVERQADLILMGMSYLKRYGAFSLGQTVPYILEHAPCSVLVLRETLAGAAPPVFTRPLARGEERR